MLCNFNSRTSAKPWSFHEIKVKISFFEDFVAKTSIQTFLNIPRQFDSHCEQNSDTILIQSVVDFYCCNLSHVYLENTEK